MDNSNKILKSLNRVVTGELTEESRREIIKIFDTKELEVALRQVVNNQKIL